MPVSLREGTTFVFSEINELPEPKTQFVATFTAERYNLLIHTSRRRLLELTLAEDGEIRCLANDMLVVSTPQGEFIITFVAWHTIAGVLPTGAWIALHFEDEPRPPADDRRQLVNLVGRPTPVISVDQDALVLLTDADHFALAYGHTLGEAKIRAVDGLRVDLAQYVRERL